MPRTVESLSGPELRDLFDAATKWLEQHIEQVNAVNVFPVPDGDTGTNMYLTMRSTMEEAAACEDPAAGAVLAAMSHGALMGARGNSGVILSQIIRGLARGAEGMDALDTAGLSSGLDSASEVAYKAVTTPTEGTILTVIRDTAEAVHGQNGGDVTSLVEVAVRAAQDSVERTPSLLPVLAEAGVVDAGGLGLSIILEGALRHLRGEKVEGTAVKAGSVGQDWLSTLDERHQAEESAYGYCTEVLVRGGSLDADVARERMSDLGDSVLVVGDDTTLRIHVHTDNPGAVLAYGTDNGSLVQVKVDNITEQAERFVSAHGGREQAGESSGTQDEAISTVAVVAGDGLAELFRSTGCSRVVAGGPTMNPSTREIVEAVEACPAQEVIVLPNDKNILMAARQAAEASSKTVRVVPSRSVPQGVAALLAFNSEHDLETNLEAMEEALPTVRTIEITRAVRETSIGGVAVREGQVIAVVDDELKLTAESPEEAVERALSELVSGETSLITLYYGDEASADEAAALAETLRERFPGHEVEPVRGGQAHYQYIVSLE